MAFPITQLELDPTGQSRANLIVGEEFRLGPSRGKFHAIAPNYGPFYNDPSSWRVFKNGVELEPNVDYFGVLMYTDPTAHFNGEIDELFLVKGGVEGDVITFDYQALGGLYQNHSKGLQDLWQAFLADKRPIAWENVVNKPTSFNPSYHLHMVDDVVGWQPVLLALERLTNAVILKNIPAFEALVEYVSGSNYESVTVPEIQAVENVDKVVSFNRLLTASETLNFNAITLRPTATKYSQKEEVVFNIQSTHFPRRETLYWTVLHETTSAGTFEEEEGVVLIKDNEARIVLKPNPRKRDKGLKTFRLELRRGSTEGVVICESKEVFLSFDAYFDYDYGATKNGVYDLLSTMATTLTQPTAETWFVANKDWEYKQHGY